MSLKEKLKRKKNSEMEGLLQNQRDVLYSELADEHCLHESRNFKEADANDEPDEGLGHVDNIVQR